MRIRPVRLTRLPSQKHKIAVIVVAGPNCLMGNQSALSLIRMMAIAVSEVCAMRQRISGRQYCIRESICIRFLPTNSEQQLQIVCKKLIIYQQYLISDMDKPINQIINIKSLEQVKSYLQSHPSLNLAIMMDKSANTLLHFSAFKNDILRLRLFIRHYKEFTEMHHGSGMYTGESSFTSKLRAWVNSPNKQGYLPIHYAALHGNIDMIEFLSDCGTNMHFRTTKDQNVLFMCVDHNRIKPLVYFLESNNNYNVNQFNYRQETILHLAAYKGYVDITAYLLTVGADIQAKNNEGQTPLILAVTQNKKQVVKYLLIKGADRHQVNNENKRAIDIARENNRQQLVKILNDQYSCWDNFKIKCNKKIVYAPEESSYMYSIFFILLFHLFFLPVNILSEFKIDAKYIKPIPLMFEGIYQLFMIVLYVLLLAKFRKRTPRNLKQLQPPFCPQCKRKFTNKIFHCHICSRCVYRYDHHCPWINGCVGSHNIGKFTLFLFILAIGLVEVLFCNLCLLIKKDDWVDYRNNFSQIPDGVHYTINIITILFSVPLLLAIVKLFLEQLHNIFTNTTSYERRKRENVGVKKSELLSSETSMTDIEGEQQQENKSSCPYFSNCLAMLSQPS